MHAYSDATIGEMLNYTILYMQRCCLCITTLSGTCPNLDKYHRKLFRGV